MQNLYLPSSKIKSSQNNKSIIVLLSIFFLFQIHLTSCTFGSVGDKLEEDVVILENFLRLVREIPGTFQPILHSYDDQADDDLSRFNLNSGTGAEERRYSVEILPTLSYLEIERMDFRFNPPGRPFGSLSVQSTEKNLQQVKSSSQDSTKLPNQQPHLPNSVRTHTPFTIPLDLPPNDPYAQIYSSPGFRIDSFMTGNSEGSGLGTVARNPLTALRNAPQGILAQSRVLIRRWDLHIRITQTDPTISPPANTRVLRISFRGFEETLLPRCKTETSRSNKTEWVLGMNYSRLFRDNPAQGVTLLNRIFDETNGTPTETIVITDISPFYTYFQTNLESDDAVLIQESCLL